MRYLFQIIIASLLLISCQIEDENAPAPDETYIKYYGELTSYEATDIEVVYDATGEVAEGLIVFGTKLTAEGDRDYYVLLTDLEGNLVDSVSYGFVNQTDRDFTGDGNPDDFRGDEIAGQIERIPGGGYITIGTSSITENALDISDFRVLTLGFLGADLTLANDTLLTLVAQQDNTELDLEGNDVLFLSDESILLVGAKEFNRGGGISDFDNYYLKFNFTDGIVFEQTQGVAGDGNNDVAVRAFEKQSGNIVFIGYSNTPSLRGENGGVNGTNAYFIEVDPNGTPVNSAAYGIDDPNDAVIYNDQVFNAIKTSFGYAIVGTSTTADDEEYGFIMNLSNNGIFLSANSHDSSIYNTENRVLENRGRGIVQAQSNDLIMLGQYTSFISGTNSRGGEGMFVKFDQAANSVEGAESFFGLSDGNDNIVDAVTLPDGKIVAVANVDFGGGVKLISIIKLNSDGSLD